MIYFIQCSKEVMENLRFFPKREGRLCVEILAPQRANWPDRLLKRGKIYVKMEPTTIVDCKKSPLFINSS